MIILFILCLTVILIWPTVLFFYYVLKNEEFQHYMKYMYSPGV